jgi:hypothetical protein
MEIPTNMRLPRLAFHDQEEAQGETQGGKISPRTGKLAALRHFRRNEAQGAPPSIVASQLVMATHLSYSSIHEVLRSSENDDMLG